MGAFDTAFAPENLARAWRWIRSNPDAAYKNYFRHLYSNYAIADAVLLQDLHERLKRGVYEPDHACKLYFPKRSGVLRPYSLLTVEDQIVYQAMVNVVAEHLFPKVRGRYFKEIFGHLYAGKPSTWFYLRWQRGFSEFNNAARQAVADGFTVTASFDLTAFYDSLDHGVLRHFLGKLGCGRDFAEKLTSWLSVWTATKDRIYHNHGIPQGPLSSGLLSEVVLQHFDQKRGSNTEVRYLRYVDDIRLFAKSDSALRRMLLQLDMLSKSVGLFPQSSKIDIHEVTDIEAELKSASGAAERFLDEDGDAPDQAALRKRLVELSPRCKLGAFSTEFKFLLGRARPSAQLNDRLWRILDLHPDLYGSILHYFQKYKTLPPRAARRLVGELKADQLYPAVLAELLRTAEGRLSATLSSQVDRVVSAKWKPTKLPADLVAVLGRWAIRRKVLDHRRMTYAILNVQEWWARADLIAYIDEQFLGRSPLADLLNLKLGDRVSDVAIAASTQLQMEFLPVTADYGKVHPVAARILQGFGQMPSGTESVCGVHLSMERMLPGKLPVIDWRAVFAADYPQAERQALWCRAYADTDITAWVNAMDLFDDLLLTKLFAHDPSIGKYPGGAVGGILSCVKFKTKYPAVHELAEVIHDKRKESALSHPWAIKAGKPRKPTRRIRYTFLRKGRQLLRAAIGELAAKW